jgi:flagellar hook protein FlgE
MMCSLFAGVSGLKNHQTRMDIIGNNIANVNTVGYKKSRVSFQEMLSQNLRGASSPTKDRGGINPIQVGLGMSLASIDVIHTSGSFESTGKNTDLAIEGEGFFVLGSGDEVYYTRAGNFDFDFNMSFYNKSNGMFVKGILADANGEINPKGEIVPINLNSHLSSPPHATSNIDFGKNLDSRASLQTGTETVGHTTGTPTILTLDTTSLPITGITIEDSSGNVLTEGAPDGFTVNYHTGEVTIAAGAASENYTINYQMANYGTSVSIFDSKGDVHTVNVYFTKTAYNTWEVVTFLDNQLNSGGRGMLTFDPVNGKLTSSTVTNVVQTVDGADELDFTLDFGNVTEYADNFTITYTNQNGYAAGDLQGISVDTRGIMTGTFSNGQRRNLAQVVIATFANPAGLLKTGSNLYIASSNSGEPNVGLPNQGGRGLIKPETLEMSNVDLSQEFVDMIITQRGFQANSRIITTSDQILEELVNLRR